MNPSDIFVCYENVSKCAFLMFKLFLHFEEIFIKEARSKKTFFAFTKFLKLLHCKCKTRFFYKTFPRAFHFASIAVTRKECSTIKIKEFSSSRVNANQKIAFTFEVLHASVNSIKTKLPFIYRTEMEQKEVKLTRDFAIKATEVEMPFNKF